MIWELIVVCALALTADAQSVALDTDTALYILCGILGVSALVCLLLVICIAVFCWKLCQLRLETNRECGDLSDIGKMMKSTSHTHSNLSLPMEANPAYEKVTPPGSQGVATTTLASSLSQNSLSDLNLDHFRPSVLTRDEKEKSPTTPTSPQGFDYTPLLSRQGDAGNPCSIPEIQVEGEQKTFNSITSSPWRDEPNISLTSVSPRSRPRSQKHHHLSGVNPPHHSNTLQPVPLHQGHLKGTVQAQLSPHTKHAQTYLDSLAASVTPKSQRRYSPALARKMDASSIRGSVSTPEQLGMKRLHSGPKNTMDHKQQLKENCNETVTTIDEEDCNEALNVDLSWFEYNSIDKGDLERQFVHVPLSSDVKETDDEVLLRQLCYMATGIKQLTVTPDGGTFTLGSGDASLEFSPGGVEKQIFVHYAIILHGPFVFPAGYKPGSVIIYVNIDGGTLRKPFKLFLSHWCIREEGDDGNTLKFVRAPHTLEAGQQAYVFEEQELEADLSICTNVGALTIREPRCLYCVEAKIEKAAHYSAITFSQYILSKETLLFRMQFMCDSLEWNEKLTSTLLQRNWEKISNDVTQFQYAAGQQQITASPKERGGPGWEAVIDGQHAVTEQRFLVPMRKSKSELEREVNSGRFPPYILYQILYTSPQEKRIKPAWMKVDIHGADVPLSFCCKVEEEMMAIPPVSPTFSKPDSGAAKSPSPVHVETATVNTRDLLIALKHRLDAKWRHFGTFLGVDYQIMEAIQRDKGGNPGDCMLDLLGKWTSNQAGTGALPRTWQTVVEAVQDSGDIALAQDLAH